MRCDGKCFECKYPDCIASDKEILFLENFEKYGGQSPEQKMEEILKYRRDYYAKNKDKIRTYQRKYRADQKLQRRNGGAA